MTLATSIAAFSGDQKVYVLDGDATLAGLRTVNVMNACISTRPARWLARSATSPT